MATGVLGQASLAAATNTTVYTVPSAKVGVFNISVTNRGTNYVNIRLAIASTATPTDAEWIEYDTLLAPKETMERGGIVANAAEQVVAYSDLATTSVSVYGYEE